MRGRKRVLPPDFSPMPWVSSSDDEHQPQVAHHERHQHLQQHLQHQQPLLLEPQRHLQEQEPLLNERHQDLHRHEPHHQHQHQELHYEEQQLRHLQGPDQQDNELQVPVDDMELAPESPYYLDLEPDQHVEMELEEEPAYYSDLELPGHEAEHEDQVQEDQVIEDPEDGN